MTELCISMQTEVVIVSEGMELNTVSGSKISCNAVYNINSIRPKSKPCGTEQTIKTTLEDIQLENKTV